MFCSLALPTPTVRGHHPALQPQHGRVRSASLGTGIEAHLCVELRFHLCPLGAALLRFGLRGERSTRPPTTMGCVAGARGVRSHLPKARRRAVGSLHYSGWCGARRSLLWVTTLLEIMPRRYLGDDWRLQRPGQRRRRRGGQYPPARGRAVNDGRGGGLPRRGWPTPAQTTPAAHHTSPCDNAAVLEASSRANRRRQRGGRPARGEGEEEGPAEGEGQRRQGREREEVFGHARERELEQQQTS